MMCGTLNYSSQQYYRTGITVITASYISRYMINRFYSTVALKGQ